MTVKRFGLAAIVFAFAGASLALSATAAPAPSGSLVRHGVSVKGMNRSYLQYVPRNLKPNSPLLFVFHGSGGDGEGMREITGAEFDVLADTNSFVVVYPDGFQNTWNDCRKASPQPARRMNIDDKSFIDAMIEKQVADSRIDRRRIFAAGCSNGGQLAYRLALERPEQFAGVASISASRPTMENLACTPTDKPMAVMIINGTADPINPFNGGEVKLGFSSLGNVLSSRETGQYFARLNGITKEPVTTRLPHRTPSDPTSVDQISWSEPGKPPVMLYAVNGGGHVVPNRVFDFGGGQTRDLDAPVAIWDFFSKVPIRE
jgi:polyhydroxybutyrate depolymerase